MRYGVLWMGGAVNCVLCGKALTRAAVLIGGMPVGPKCVKNANLMPLAAKKRGAVLPGPAFRKHATKAELDQLDLFSVGDMPNS